MGVACPLKCDGAQKGWVTLTASARGLFRYNRFMHHPALNPAIARAAAAAAASAA